eukprot:Hpha_TRINITY_DN8425_c0_g2::TRINITY_DN8425_c0_g2_i1::g.34845::m.34845
MQPGGSMAGSVASSVERRSVLVPATVLLVLAALVSTCVSIAGGVILYLESLSTIEATVQEVAEAEVLVAHGDLSQYFAATSRVKETVDTLFGNWQKLQTFSDLGHFCRELEFAMLKSSRYLNGFGVEVSPNVSTDPYGGLVLYQALWWDPLTNASAIKRNNGSTRQFVDASYSGYEDNDCGNCCLRNSTRRCVFAHSMNSETGRNVGNVYNYSRFKMTNESFHVHSEGWQWQQLSVWASEDGTPYWYADLRKIVPGYVPGHPMFGGGTEIVVWMMMYEWSRDLARTNPTGFLFVAEMGRGLQGNVIASSRNELIKCGNRDNDW